MPPSYQRNTDDGVLGDGHAAILPRGWVTP